MCVECDYSDNHLVKLASFGTARWRKKSKTVGCPLDPVILSQLFDYLTDVELSGELQEWVDNLYHKQQAIIGAVADDSPLSEKPLVPFQMASVRFMAAARRCILGHEMGTGKTPISCVAIDHVGASKVLIVCPNSVKWSWVSHLEDWSTERNIYVMESSSASMESSATIISGNKSSREDQLAHILTTKSECTIIINYAQLRIHLDTFDAFDYDVIIADESHRLNNRQAQQTIAFQKLAKRAVYVWMLTGTPVRNNYTDLFSPLRTCDQDRFTSYWNFVNIYLQSVPGRWGGVDIIGLRDPNGFNSMLSTFMYRVTKAEAMPHLPPKLYSDMRLVLTEEQSAVYHQMEEEFIMAIKKQLEDGETLETILSAPNTAAQIIRLRQICLTPESIGGPTSSSKLTALDEILEDIEGSFIVFTCFRKFLPFVGDLLKQKKIPFGEIVGGQSSIDRAEVEQALNSGEIRAILGTIQSMGEGLNLQKATTAIFCDQDWVPATNAQAEDRIHRGNIEVSPTIVRLFHPGTVESDIRAACKRKEQVIGDTTGRVEAVRSMLLRRGVKC